jgi:hypothetical protein
MTDTEREALKAEARFARRRQIMQPRKPISLTRFGLFVAGLFAGALFTTLVAFVMSVSGTVAGVALAVGTGMILAVIGTNMGDHE